MNALIETLAKQAGMVQYPTGLGISENTIWGDRNIARFAESIVRECAGVTLDYKNNDHYAGWCDHSAEILTHFGIEQ
jgi:hypothetical protein